MNKTITIEDITYEFEEAALSKSYGHRSEDGAHMVVVNHIGAVWLDGQILGVGRDVEDGMEIGICAMLQKSKPEGGDTEDETENTEQE